MVKETVTNDLNYGAKTDFHNISILTMHKKRRDTY